MILYPLSTHHGGQRWASPSYLIFSTSLLKIEEAHTGEKARCQIQKQIQIQTQIQIETQTQIQILYPLTTLARAGLPFPILSFQRHCLK